MHWTCARPSRFCNIGSLSGSSLAHFIFEKQLQGRISSPFSFFLLWNFGCLSEKVEQTSSHLTPVANWSNLQMKKHISFALIRLFGTERQLDSRYCTTNASYIQYKENDKTSDYTWSLYSFVYSNKNGNMYLAKISNFYFFKQTVGSTIRVNQV